MRKLSRRIPIEVVDRIIAEADRDEAGRATAGENGHHSPSGAASGLPTTGTPAHSGKGTSRSLNGYRIERNGYRIESKGSDYLFRRFGSGV